MSNYSKDDVAMADVAINKTLAMLLDNASTVRELLLFMATPGYMQKVSTISETVIRACSMTGANHENVIKLVKERSSSVFDDFIEAIKEKPQEIDPLTVN